MNTKVTKYLYLSKSTKRYSGSISARISSNKNEIKKNEICLKLDLDIDTDVFSDSIPSIKLDIPKDYKARNINLRIG
ncbi:MAG: hypothetical protein M0R17_02970 [Candidatus Omnitrophica bacterium]|jgi:hypothetical protein|nr:hypothetical protein [Candidatus Omnitrophota bacterium]